MVSLIGNLALTGAACRVPRTAWLISRVRVQVNR